MQQNQNLPLRELLEDAWEEVYDLHDLMVIEEDAQDLVPRLHRRSKLQLFGVQLPRFPLPVRCGSPVRNIPDRSS